MFLVLSLIANIVAVFYLYKFATIIMVFEDDITDVLSSLDDVNNSIKGVEQLKMFFDDLELKAIVSEVMESVKMSRHSVNEMSKRFTARSKRKYILLEDINENIVNNNNSNGPLQNNQIIETFDSNSSRKLKEGTIAHVGRTD
jgi:hypothetical protein